MKTFAFLFVFVFTLLTTQCTVDEASQVPNTTEPNKIDFATRSCGVFSVGEFANNGALHNEYLDLISAEFNCLTTGQEADAIAAL